MRSLRHAKHRAAFTLLEILSLVTIIALLAALLLSAVQAARETARLATCLNNLRQIGMSMASYSSVINAFPQGVNGRGYSIHTMLLPYMDHVSLFNSINFHHASYLTGPAPSQVNETVGVTKVAAFACPSDPPFASLYGTLSYPGNRGSGVQTFGYDGAFSIESEGIIGPQAFTDGLSQTSAFSEWVINDPTPGVKLRGRKTFKTPWKLTGPDELDQFASLCRRMDSSTAEPSILAKGMGWLRGELGFTLYNHVLEPNANSCTNRTAVQLGAWTAGSFHVGRTNVLFADGHASTVTESISTPVWRAIGSRNRGDIVPDGEF